jgi:hypothetical protein
VCVSSERECVCVCVCVCVCLMRVCVPDFLCGVRMESRAGARGMETRGGRLREVDERRDRPALSCHHSGTTMSNSRCAASLRAVVAGVCGCPRLGGVAGGAAGRGAGAHPTGCFIVVPPPACPPRPRPPAIGRGPRPAHTSPSCTRFCGHRLPRGAHNEFYRGDEDGRPPAPFLFQPVRAAINAPGHNHKNSHLFSLFLSHARRVRGRPHG